MQTKQISELAASLITSLDLDSYDSTQTGVLVLLDPITQAPTTSTITLASPENPIRKKLDFARQRKMRADMQKTGKVQFTDPAEEQEEETEYLVACTVEWNLTQGGVPLELSADAARKLYTNPKKFWVRSQAVAALNKSELFIKDSAKP